MTGTLKVETFENGVLTETEIRKDSRIDIAHWRGWLKLDKSLGAKAKLETRYGYMYKYITHSPYGNTRVVYTLIDGQ